jgi:hypothetical protein
MELLIALVGLTLITLGRKLFWLFVACVGFSLGFTYAQGLWNVQSDGVCLAIAIIVGLTGALLAVFLQAFAIAVSGFSAGGFIMMHFLNLLGVEGTRSTWLLYVIGGVIGAAALLLFFDWALIFLSSLLGSALIVQTAHLGSLPEKVLFIALAVVGILFQARLLRGGRSSGASSQSSR